MKNILRGYDSLFRDHPDVVNVEEMRQMLGGIGRRTAYRLLKDREIESVMPGRTYLIPKISIIQYLCKNEVEQE